MIIYTVDARFVDYTRFDWMPDGAHEMCLGYFYTKDKAEEYASNILKLLLEYISEDRDAPMVNWVFVNKRVIDDVGMSIDEICDNLAPNKMFKR